MVAAVHETVDVDLGLSVADEPRRGKKRGGDMRGASSVSSGVRLEGISKTYKNHQLLKNVTWEVTKGERVGLVGVNGAGKTTQLRIIVGEEEPDEGVVMKAKEDMKISFLTQEFTVVPTRTVREEFMSAFEEQMEVKQRIEWINQELEKATDDMDRMSALLDELDLYQRRAQTVDLYSIDAKIDKMMPELGFTPEDNDRLVASYSGGWQMRMSLGKILLQDPDLLLLDEPTNHLDLDTIEWLEKYLKQQDVPMVIVSHDRAFLDQLSTKIVETDMGVAKTFPGNYSEYVGQKAADYEAQLMAWEKQQKEIERQQEIIDRLAGGANTGRASMAEKMLEKLKTEQLIEKPFNRKVIPFRFPETERSGREVFTIENLTHGYGDKLLFDKASLQIERGEKLAFIGPNGSGKSTLLRLLLGREQPQAGEIILGGHRVLPNYFEQNQAEALDLDKTVLQTVVDAATDWKLNEIKGLLGKLYFKGDTIHKKVEFLSGGEKARVALAKFMVTPATVLIFDEPTNHLDIPSKEVLEDALRAFEGTVIAVSHDRYFLRQIVNRVVEIKGRKLADYVGDYNYYLEQNLEARRKELEREAELEAAAPKIKSQSKMTRAEREVQKKQKEAAKKEKAQKISAGQGKAKKNAKRWN
ncbi:ABC transporter family protein [Klebsormidium nitens]|uniref:ABC transporter family protein n=1 Tax=Klebsormidium nitens TaxID=105231 RepID=A0A1Y1IIY5_KLENI|nr:ABC transporter family protein [Klebsormidium nitens]|eukprot:GAQ89091.1 ABC transporter family protein [Klebsormidium nitens]